MVSGRRGTVTARAVAETVQYNAPKLTVVSSLTGEPAEPGELERPE